MPAPEAAWINGTAGRALDYDDVALRGHPSTVLVPAILPEGETLHASGRDMLAAYVAGYETCAELAWCDPGHHHRKGWHPTGIFGPIGAAAACASPRHLDAEHASNALALAASQSSGVMANFGTMTTPFHAGRSAHSGLITARLAEVGFTASPDAIEHPRGFLSAVSPAGEADRETPAQALGSEWKILKYRLGIKKYPACYCTHRALDAMIELLAHHPLEPREIHRVRVLLSDTHSLIVRNHWPQTGLEGKFSMEFAMAAAVTEARRARRIYRRLCSAPGCPGFDAPDHHRNKPELRSGGLRSHGIGPGTGRPRSPAATSKARKCGGLMGMQTAPSAKPSCSTNSAAVSTRATQRSHPTSCSSALIISKTCRRANSPETTDRIGCWSASRAE